MQNTILLNFIICHDGRLVTHNLVCSALVSSAPSDLPLVYSTPPCCITYPMYLQEMQKEGDVGDAVSANLFQPCLFFGLARIFFAQFCAFFHICFSCRFLLFFACFCAFFTRVFGAYFSNKVRLVLFFKLFGTLTFSSQPKISSMQGHFVQVDCQI